MDRKVLAVVLVMAAVLSLLLFVLLGCSQDQEAKEVFNVLGSADSSAPVLVSVTSVSSSVIRLEFNEPVRVYGNLPGVLINEFTTKGTARSPDRTELLIMTPGNINGMTLYCGVPNDFDVSVVFGDIDVRTGDMIVVWWTEELPEQVPSGPSDPGGIRVFNICAGSADNLPSNNGTLVICDNPALGSSVIDAVVYSNYSQSHEGFGTRSALERARWVIESGAWSGDAVDSTSSTATRSMGRLPGFPDTDGGLDWIVTVTGGSTFGAANTAEAY